MSYAQNYICAPVNQIIWAFQVLIQMLYSFFAIHMFFADLYSELVHV